MSAGAAPSRPTDGAAQVHRVGRSTAFAGYPAAVVAAGLIPERNTRPARDDSAPRRFDHLARDVFLGQQGFPLAEEAEEEVALDAWGAHLELERVLALVGIGQDQLLRMRIWQEDKRFYPAYERVRMVRQPHPCPSSGHAVRGGLAGGAGFTLGLDGVAIAPAADVGRPEVRSSAPPGQSGYALAARHGKFAFLGARNPQLAGSFAMVQSFDDVPDEGRTFATGRSHTDSRDGPIAAQTWQIYSRLRELLGTMGGSLADIAHCLVGLQDIRDLAMFHRVHNDMFGDAGPALTIVGAGEVGHRGGRVYIEPTVYFENDTQRIDWPGRAPLAAPLARRAGDLMFLSGIAAISEDGRMTADNAPIGPEGRACLEPLTGQATRPELPMQAWRAWTNLAAALERAGSSLDRLVKITVFIADAADWPVFDAVRRAFMPEDLPAIECIGVPHPGPSPRSVIQIDAVAITNSEASV